MPKNWFPAAALLATFPLGCSSRVEVEYDAGEVCTATYTGDRGNAGNSKAGTRLRVVAERTISVPRVMEESRSPPLAVSPAPTEVRYVPVPSAAPVVTSIHVGEIDIRVGDVIHVHGATQATDDSPERSENRLQRHPDPLRSPLNADASTQAAEKRCERLLRKHEDRVRQWEALFAR